MRHCLCVQKYREQIQEMQFSLRNIVKVDLLSKLIQLVMFLKDNLIIFLAITLALAWQLDWQDWMSRGQKS